MRTEIARRLETNAGQDAKLISTGRSCHMSEGERNEKTELILTNKLTLLSQPCLT